MSTIDELQKKLAEKIAQLPPSHSLAKAFNPVVGLTKGGKEKAHKGSLVNRKWSEAELRWLIDQADQELFKHAEAEKDAAA